MRYRHDYTVYDETGFPIVDTSKSEAEKMVRQAAKNGARLYIKHTAYRKRVGGMVRMRKERITVRGHSVRRHKSRSYEGTPETVSKHRVRKFTEEREEPWPRGKRLGIKAKHHPGYSASYTPEENVRIGIKAAIRRHQRMPYLHVEKELAWQGLLRRRKNPRVSESFYAAARLAKERHMNPRYGECGRSCQHRHYV